MSLKNLEIGTRRWEQMEKIEHMCLLCDEQTFEDETCLLINYSKYEKLSVQRAECFVEFSSKHIGSFLNELYFVLDMKNFQYKGLNTLLN